MMRFTKLYVAEKPSKPHALRVRSSPLIERVTDLATSRRSRT